MEFEKLEQMLKSASPLVLQQLKKLLKEPPTHDRCLSCGGENEWLDYCHSCLDNGESC